jgi:hypothetical protein
LESTEVLAQVGFLQILGEEARLSYKQRNLYMDGGREPAPEHLAYAIPMLQSPSSLVRYFATTTVWKLIAAIRSPDNWGVVREQVDGKILLIVESVLELAREYGVSNLMHVVSRLVKDPFLLEQIVGYAPSFTATAFDLAGEFYRVEQGLPPVLNSMLNLVVCLKDHPDEEDRICRQIFENCMASIESICENAPALDAFIEVFNIVVLYTPDFYPELWRFMEVLVQIPMDGLSCDIRSNAVYLFHNLMMRDSKRVGTDLPLFVEFGSQLLAVDNVSNILSVIWVYNSALFACAPPDSIPAEYIALLCQALELHAWEGPDGLFQECLSEIWVPDQFMLSLLQYDPAIVVEHLPELFAQWFELAEDADCACALALAFALMPPDFRQQQLARVLSVNRPQDLLKEDDDVDTQMFESEGHVQVRAIPVCPREKAFRIFVEFLKELVTEDPQLAAALEVQSFLDGVASEYE